MQVKGSTSEIVINVRRVSLYSIVHGLLKLKKIHLGSENVIFFF